MYEYILFMALSSFTLALIAICIVSQVAAQSNYCGEISASETAGASGYLSLTIGTGVAYYKPYLDLTQWSLLSAQTCDTSQLTYHIHSYWTNSTASSSHTSYCASTITGGHYDPNLACGPSSQNSAVSPLQEFIFLSNTMHLWILLQFVLKSQRRRCVPRWTELQLMATRIIVQTQTFKKASSTSAKSGTPLGSLVPSRILRVSLMCTGSTDSFKTHNRHTLMLTSTVSHRYPLCGE